MSCLTFFCTITSEGCNSVSRYFNQTEPVRTYVHGSEDGKLQQGGGEAVSEGEDEGGLLSEQLLHGVLQPQVQTPVTLHKVRQTAARLQKLLHLRGGGVTVI